MNFESSQIPVLGGYWLVTHLIPTRTDALRRSGYHTAFQSAFWGLILLAASYPAAVLLQSPDFGFFPTGVLSDPFDRAAILSVALGILVPLALNPWLDQEKIERKTASRRGDLIELLIADSIDRGRLVEVSLRSGKSYIGFPNATRIARWPESHVSIFPLSSGYRDKETQELKITTHYAPVVRDYLGNKGGLTRGQLRDLCVVIPRSDIISIRLFDPDLRERFEEAANPPEAVEPSPTRQE